jgi:membrane protein
MAVIEAGGHSGQNSRDPFPLWLPILTIGLLLFGFKPRNSADAQGFGAADSESPRSGADRGRAARTPSEIPALGWKDILFRLYDNIGNHRVIAIAAGVTFYSILALFPAIAALVALYGLFADPATIWNQLGNFSGVLPSGAIQIMSEEMHRVAAQGNNKLGVTFIIGLAIALWSANAGIKALMDALNLVYDEPEKRGIIKLNAVSLAFTSAAIVFLLLAVAAVIVLPLALDYIGFPPVTDQITRAVRWPVLLALVTLAIAVLYRYGPSRDKPQWRWVSWGSAFAAIAWVVASILFSWYAANFGSYNKTYGSLGAVIGFMIWMWMSTIVILIGGELDAEMEHQTRRDTTTGRSAPMGQRGAKMADTVGAARD